MKVITGDHLGICKIVNVDSKAVEFKIGEPSLENAILKLDVFDEESTCILRPSLLSVLHHNEQIESFSAKPDKSAEYVSGFASYSDSTKSYYCAQNDGCIKVYQNKDSEEFDFTEDSLKGIKLDKSLKLNRISALKNQHEFFALFEDCPLRIFDINKDAISFKSKNVPNDELDLRVPIFDTDVVQENSNHNVFYVSTAFGKIRTYDRKAKIQPVSDQSNFTNLKIQKINRIIEVDNYLCIGDSQGKAILLEKRKSKSL